MKKRLQLQQLDLAAPKKQTGPYKQFLCEQLAIQHLKYPQRTIEELTKLINLMWKVREKKNNQLYFQHNGYVNISETERVPVPQPSPPVLIIFQKNMRQLLEFTHPEYNAEQVDHTIKFEWTLNSTQRQKAAEEFRQLRQEFEKEKKEFINRYGFWPQHKKSSGEYFDKTKQSSPKLDPLALNLMKKVKLE
ncbi:unnamed protein product (macronuclear) [Paramecium tetraurelia]|uniref:HMG box domain-containing protein n=1 Tax=Paramecium tetraurelia TaxID=5888 RepID=A0DS22_PARTE|nr:uncharacterized protein GSPATT00019543001 [Paramecium tetraurelia]CAK85839.1 unnamed protein product [Paramecium tetraurelia]|eukprot:XP_001453236.1 hypothetical protein (macronuclear) [Paramecium tetraurelia strain d4-2]